MGGRRRRRSGARRRARRGRGRSPLGWLAVALVAYIVCVNAAVRARGGAAGWLDARYLGDKSVALALWLRHALTAPVRGPGARPEQALRRAARRHGVSTELVLAVARAESSLQPDRISATGAMGLMQLMPDTAAALGVGDPFDAAENADGGARYLAELRRRYGGALRRVLAAYNAGPGRVPRRGPLRLPGETRAYLEAVLRLMPRGLDG